MSSTLHLARTAAVGKGEEPSPVGRVIIILYNDGAMMAQRTTGKKADSGADMGHDDDEARKKDNHRAASLL